MHDVLTFTVALLCLAAIISPRVPTGILGTAGLGIIGGASIWAADDFATAYKVLDVMLAGMLLIGLQTAWRVLRRRANQMRRREDWGPAAPQSQPQEVDEARHVHIVGGRK